ncbi:polysaccharide biosynthesis C-terminal domain-containing protein [Chryseobacterium sp. CFBP8996]|uniref:polysaccharide biosynthesis C-terminal domain-containing protein n=1 Tax=Chryseobacterium sp. CFBP8996 TaxID=3096529 RepID=UPI002A6B66F7|nr:polysaccharide biosynthesis C-terminal domain-containing protein [Chryseobacterium sp. CFBP8996]MDY0933052.1 polysaccharide biosynthesis C-terminal domain-containing protein [Chryseobacterium sp. CFBP8996]
MFSKILSSSFGINFIKKCFTILSGIIFLVLMTRFLGPSLRGEYAYIMNYVNIFATIFNLGISLVMPSYLRNKKDFTVDDFISLSIYQFIFNLFLVFIFYLATGNLMVITILFLSSISILSLQLNNITLVTDIKLNSVSFIISSIVNIILIVFVYFFLDVKLYYIILVYLTKESVLILSNIVRIRFKFLKFRKKWFLILKTAFLPMLTTSLIAINYRVDVVMLENYKIEFFLIGLFSTGVALSEYSWLVTDIFKEVMLNKNTKRDEINLTSLSIRFAFTSVLAFAIGFSILGKFILNIMFGKEFIPAYYVTLSMLLAVPFMGFVKIIGTLFITQGKWIKYFYILLLTVLINILLNMVLIPVLGIFGSALASIFSYMFCGLRCLFWYSKKYNISVLKLFIINKSDISVFTSYFKK